MEDEMAATYEVKKPSTNILLGTSAEYAYKLYCDKMEQIRVLEYECEMLVDKYHSEMRLANIPAHFREDFLEDMFSKNNERRKWARDFFLEQCFYKAFLSKNKVEFDTLEWNGYNRTAAGVRMAIGNYLYTVEIPIPANLNDPKDKKCLVGRVKFRVDRIPKSKKSDFVRVLEPVIMPTYDWKACFEAIEKSVGKGE